VAITGSEANTEEIFNQIQELLRTRRSVLGESDYQCFTSGECVSEYQMEGLVTYKEEALCTRSEEGCGEGVMVLERAKREEMCMNMDEDMELCKRSVEPQPACGMVMEKIEEMGCGEIIVERKVRRKRDMCVALKKRFSGLCSGRRKRAISDGCNRVMEAMESSDCASEVEFLSKRQSGCPDGWTARQGVCYKYFKDPLNFAKANNLCKGAAADSSSRLATIQSMSVDTLEDRKFFDSLIESSGAVEHIDSVLSTMDDMFEGKNWKEVIEYYDNWAWIGVKSSGDDWKWAVPSQKEADWSPVKIGQDDWRKSEPSQDHDLRMDNGNCGVYFHNRKERIDSSLSDKTDEGEVKAWWNANCELELPFLCEVRAN